MKIDNKKDNKEDFNYVKFYTASIVGGGIVFYFNPILGVKTVLSSVALWSGYKFTDILTRDLAIEKKRWEDFFLAIGIKTGLNEAPMFAKKVETQKGHKYIFKNPIGFSTHQLKSKETAVNEFLGSKFFEAEIVGEWLTIEAVENNLPKIVDFEIIPSRHNVLEVAIGKTLEGYAYLNFSSMPHTLISGATGSGKSGVTHAILTQLACNYSPRKLHLYLADLKRVELSKYKDLAITKEYVKTEEETEKLIDKMLEICEDRYDKLERLKVNKIENYNKKVDAGAKMPYVILCIEECVRLVNNKTIQKKLSELLFISRACGVYVICTIQRPTRANISPEIKSSLGNIIGLQTVNKRNSEVICEDDRLKNLRGNGHAWLFKDNEEVEFQSFYLNDETDDIDNILKANCKMKK